MKKNFFNIAFQLDRMTIFEVSYYRLGNNKNPHFATSSAHFMRSKRDFDRCGQSQDTLLPKFPLAFNFYKKFDPLHLQDLTDVQYNEIIEGITKLKSAYNSIEEGAPITGYFSFSKLVELSKLTPKK